METATPGVKSTQDGWLNRYLHAREHEAATPFRAVALAPQLPRALQGIEPALAIEPDRPVRHPRRAGDRRGAGVVRIGVRGRGRQRAAIAPAREAFDAVKMLKAADPGKYTPENGAEYPRSAFGEALRQIAQLVKADVGLEVAFAESAAGTPRQPGPRPASSRSRLDDFAAAIAALARDLGDAMDDVVILTMSEFGRAVAENGNRGTDHGHGNAMLVHRRQTCGAARSTAGGRGSRREQRYDGRDLAVTTDFRSVFAEVVHGHLGMTARPRCFPDSPKAVRSGCSEALAPNS